MEALLAAARDGDGSNQRPLGGANASPRSFRLTIPLTVLPTRQPHHDLNSVPGGIRTHVTGVKGRCPRPG